MPSSQKPTKPENKPDPRKQRALTLLQLKRLPPDQRERLLAIRAGKKQAAPAP